ncbi:hypothetical protein FA15DRAFT_705429 [Coprinopsis marcescibilis]|uniref:Uncharacterized protein n=1 Tax=Coprinopsis marcescibilis TaxID=230819 RepID=A0A5C3KT52_COPMA|nr:hypothetical protein FA15DRAFT_705429 [Coprinopsis marcescibilis]
MQTRLGYILALLTLGVSVYGLPAPKQQTTFDCTVESIISIAAYTSLDRTGLFWKAGEGVTVVEAEHVARTFNRKHLRDVWDEPTENKILDSCGRVGKDGWLIMSKAMASIALGEAWAIVPDRNLGSQDDIYFNAELAILRERGVRVIRVDTDGTILGVFSPQR